VEACEILQNSLKGVQRKRINNWRRYVYSLLRKVDETAYNEMKESKEKEKEEHGSRRRSKPKPPELENPASAPSNKTLDKTATEFVPGKPWKTPEVVKTEGKTLRLDAAEFVPTAQAQVKAAALPLPASLFPPMMPPPPVHPASLGFSADFTPAWPKQEPKASKANGKATPMKPDAQEFYPGVSAWAGAMVMPKAKAKVKARPRNPVDPGLVPSQPMSPGLQSGQGAGSSPSRTPVVQSQTVAPKEIVAPAISNSCKEVFVSKVSPKVVKITKDSSEITGLLTASECAVILSTAQSLGFSTGDRLVSKDPWLAGALWERLSGVTPYILNGKRLLRLQDDLVVQHGDRSACLEKCESLAVQVCLKSSSASEGDAYISSASDGQSPEASWLTAMVQCEDSSWLTQLQVALGLAGPRSERRSRMVTASVLLASSLLVSMVLRRRRLSN